jgi:hypothetical protein
MPQILAMKLPTALPRASSMQRVQKPGRKPPRRASKGLGKRELFEDAKALPRKREGPSLADAPESESGEAETGRTKCQVIGMIYMGERISSMPRYKIERAWKMANKNMGGVYYHLFREGLLPCEKKYHDDVVALGRDAAFIAALGWNPSKGTFMTHLKDEMNRCVLAVSEMRGMGITFFPRGRRLSFSPILENDGVDITGEYCGSISAFERKEARQKLAMMLHLAMQSCLNEREWGIVSMKNWEGMGFQAIGKKFGISRARAHKIYWDAVGKLRAYKSQLSSFRDDLLH